MKEISCTITVGQGSETHNHQLSYRAGLKNVNPDKSYRNIELIQYKKDYETQINEMMKPYIDEYNQRTEAKFQEQMEKYKQGKIKNPPKYKKPMSENYYQEHLNDSYTNKTTKRVEKIPVFRELIIGLGDKNDRANKTITEEQAIFVFKKVVEQFIKDNPNLHVFGASVHLDEEQAIPDESGLHPEGFYHCHIDYKPIAEKAVDGKIRGLSVSLGQDEALKAQGLKPEQSIINGQDKAPLLFNAFRNQTYKNVEKNLNEVGIRLQYAVSAKKEPGKDSSKHQSMEVWQQTQDLGRDLQHQHNLINDIIENGNSPEASKDLMQAVNDLATTLNEVENSPKTIDRKGKKVSFKLFDQLHSLLDKVKNTLSAAVSVLKVNEELKLQNEVLKTKNTNLSKSIEAVYNENKKLKEDLKDATSLDRKIEQSKAPQKTDRDKVLEEVENTYDTFRNANYNSDGILKHFQKHCDDFLKEYNLQKKKNKWQDGPEH